jgi:catechol 2,3-dioxygenase-like lactoylglutathione lyase family enzyme
MIGYITIGAADTEQSKTFYDSVLAIVGWKPFADYGGYIGYGPDGADDGQTIWVCKPFDGEPARAGNGIMIGPRLPRRRDGSCWKRRRRPRPAAGLRPQLVRRVFARSNRQQAFDRLQDAGVAARGSPLPACGQRSARSAG